MNMRIDPISAIVRFYHETINDQTPLHEISQKYYKTVTLILMDNGDVRGTACAETLTITEIKLIMKKLAKMGYKRLLWRHHNKEVSVHL